MTKREMINEIMEINHSAGPDFLADFNDEQLDEYLSHLKEVTSPVAVSAQAEEDAALMPYIEAATAVLDETGDLMSHTEEAQNAGQWEPSLQAAESSMAATRMNLMKKINRLEALENEEQSWLF